MKKCPQCKRAYSDESLNYCLDDGEELIYGPAGEEAETAIFSTDANAPARNVPAKRSPLIPILISFISLALLATGVYWIYSGSSRRQISSIAVLPFNNENGNSDVEYLSDGIAESLINNLTEVESLKVTARGTAFRYKGKDMDPRSIGQELNVSAVLTGSVRQMGEKLNIQVDLIDTSNGAQIWGKEYERPVADVLSIKQSIAREVVDRLRLRLRGDQQQQLAHRDTSNPEAYRLYLQGRYFWFRRTEKDLQRSIECYQQAIALDPKYAVAYAGLADSYAGTGVLPTQNSRVRVERLSKGREAALKAVALDDNSPEAHTALGTVLVSSDFDFSAGEAQYRRAIELNPNYAETHYWYAFILSRIGKHTEAFAQMDRALELDPMNLVYRANHGGMLAWAGRYDESIAELEKLRELDENFAPVLGNLFNAYQRKGDYAKAIEVRCRELELNGDKEEALRHRDAFARGGWKGFLRYLTSENHPSYLSNYTLAWCYAGLGEKDKSLEALNRSYENRESQLQRLKVDPVFDLLRDDPRFNELIQRIGFPN
jgi:TolB-like protein/Tfp pilus assembly protein PilF